MGLSWSNCCWRFKVASLLAVCAAYTASGDFAQAQITPDSFLGVDRSMLLQTISTISQSVIGIIDKSANKCRCLSI
jgi:hypothetical protein